MLFKARNRHAELVRSMGTSQLMCCGRELHIRLYAYGPIEACKVPTVPSGSRPHRSGTSQRYAHPTPDLCTRRQLSGGPGLLSQRQLDTDQPARARVGTRLGSAHRVGGTRHSESLGQVRDGLPKVHGPQQVEAGSQGPTAQGAVRQCRES